MSTTEIVYADGKIVAAESNYQSFTYDVKKNTCIPTNKRTVQKWNAVKDWFPALVEGRKFMDIGASLGFFGFKALECGAQFVTCVEYKEKRCKPMIAMLKQVQLPTFRWQCEAWPNGRRAEVIMYLSVIHHMAQSSSLRSIVYDLSFATKKCAIVEWVDKEDKQVRNVRPDYSFDQFKKVASRVFSRMELKGKGHHDTRHIYLLWK